MIRNDTIIAQVTCPGKSAVGILRVSGIHANQVAFAVLGKIPKPRFATYSKFFDESKKVLDEGISLWFPAPFSLTGEDVLELQGHGNPFIMDLLIKRILCLKNIKIRIAQPGEFCQRAFLNGKIDLIQAEAIDDLINSETESVVRASLNSLHGNFSFYIQKIIKKLIEFRTNIEASIDFSEENIDFDFNIFIMSNFEKLNDKFLKIKNIVSEGSLIREAKRIVIVGPPNAGKSSLLNVLSCRDRAIVTDLPGTTRDVLYENINIHGISCEIIDTAGLRETEDKIEKIGIQRSWEMIKNSDHVLYVMDKTISLEDQKKTSIQFMKQISSYNIQEVTFVLNKNDLVEDFCGITKIENLLFISISALTGQGIDILKKHLSNRQKNKSQEGLFIARRRHIHQIDLSYCELLKAQKNWLKYKNIELLAESLNIINKLLGEITGEFTSSDLLKRIFSTFCIGK
ncbi:tRNA uridine-5-carboxymethylaminomethyl(34) synthesis GTPase MnmE [Buchnera aphidicola]|jgi:tRNA modification GTPase|uniref:tRNA uridine-5-carboxymethylaminomethyl(34) synthesis GTPase MnmE n=1 Tax=Buchnera aphidicola TaxID=9 RepID=UPI000D592525|nr:tRNA uridine-5-carboxymethylaminomethyl(34) synthesis GTPase MnmE [Buchnera aphidicola]AWI49909.1 tRNA uridine-5-carboxymethylaminomethyl(34) synthesis GTPase MnmE [Buchnera aphidicola (Schizaphis graminum)]